ncbi:MAG TPA: hypothetical protein VGN57_07625 [Pirellulaceae bacterium]|jgi:hypothetical protein|nr:hypothetical protein [Pirellulaceae bacterium]
MSQAHDPPAHPKKKSSAALRTLILIGLLVLIVAGGLWDWYGAKEPRDQAYQRVLAVQGSPGGMASMDDPPTTQADVQKAVGADPAETTAEDGVIYERYSWRRGIPWMTYDLWVLYRGDDEKELLVAQPGEEGKPDSIYAANSRGGKGPMPDPSTVRPIVDGESPYPQPKDETPGVETTAEDDAAATPAEGSDEAPAESGDAPAEPAAETPAAETAEGETPEASSDPAPAAEPTEEEASPAEEEASPAEPATEEVEPESP